MSQKAKHGMVQHKSISSIICTIFLVIAALVSIFPFYWMLSGSTNTSAAITMGKMNIGGHLASNWETLSAGVDILRVFWNTSFTTILSTVLGVLLCSMAGYGFEKYRSRAKNIVYRLFLLSMMIPFASQMIPLFRMMSGANLMNTHIAVVLPFIAVPFLIFFFRQSFVSLPTEIIEAARIDGAGEFRIFFSLVIPPMKSTFAAAAIYGFMKQWNNYLWPLIVLQTEEKKTFTLVLSALSSAYYVDYGQIMLAIVLSTLPIIVVFLTMQKQFVDGIVGSSK